MLLNQQNTTLLDERQSHLQNVRTVDPNLLCMKEEALTHLLLYGEYFNW